MLHLAQIVRLNKKHLPGWLLLHCHPVQQDPISVELHSELRLKPSQRASSHNDWWQRNHEMHLTQTHTHTLQLPWWDVKRCHVERRSGVRVLQWKHRIQCLLSLSVVFRSIIRPVSSCWYANSVSGKTELEGTLTLQLVKEIDMLHHCKLINSWFKFHLKVQSANLFDVKA